MAANLVRVLMFVVGGPLLATCLWILIHTPRLSGRLIVLGSAISAVAAMTAAYNRWGEPLKPQTVLALVSQTILLVGFGYWAVHFTIPRVHEEEEHRHDVPVQERQAT